MDSDQGKLFIGGISWETDEEKLKEHFQGYGEVLQTAVMRDKISGKPRGFGFVVFSDPDSLDRVLEDTHVIDGRTVEAKRALSREEQQVSKVGSARNVGGGGSTRTKKIFVGGLPPTLTEDGFQQYFEDYGAVTDVVIMYDQQTNRPRGFGFISFDSEEAVDRVLHKTFHDLNGKQVEVKRALPKEANLGWGGRAMSGGAGGNSGAYQGYGSSFGNSSSYDGRLESKYMHPQNAGGGYPSYGSSGYNSPGYGYGSGMGYGYGNYGGANPGYSGPAGGGYAGGPPNASRSSWGSQGPGGYGYGSSQWGTHSGGGGPSGGMVPTGQSTGWPSGFGNQGYGYGGYGGSDGGYGNQVAYGAVGGRAATGTNGSAPAGDVQPGGVSYMGGGYGDGSGNSGYGNSGWRSDQSSIGPHAGQVGYGGGYGSASNRQAQ